MFRLAFRNIFRHRLRTGITLGAVIAGVATLILSGGFIEDAFVQLRESTIHSRLGHFQVYKEGYMQHGRRNPEAYSIADPGAVVDMLQAEEHVQDVLLRVGFSGMATNGSGSQPVAGEGMQPDKEARLAGALTMMAGRNLTGADAYATVIGEGVANALQLQPGDYLTLMVSTRYGGVNTLDFEVVGVFRSFSREYDKRAVRIPLAAARELLYTDSVDKVIGVLDQTRFTRATVGALRPALERAGYEIRPWNELADFYNKTVALYQRQFAALQFIILVMMVLGVASTVNMSVYERTAEFGTLMALGDPRRKVFRLVLLENLLLGGLGAVLGVAAGSILAIVLSAMNISMPPPPGSNTGYEVTIRIAPWTLLASAGIGFAGTILAAVFPAIRASRLRIIEALRQSI